MKRGEKRVEIRPARAEEAAELTLLARRSKASWGYPEEWLAEWATELEITADYILRNTVLVAESRGIVVGVVGVGRDPDGPEVHHLWVSPESQGRGIGGSLLHRAVDVAKELGWLSLRIVSDPYALPFYERVGAKRIGDVDAPVAGTERTLPLLRLDIA